MVLELDAIEGIGNRIQFQMGVYVLARDVT